jgi:GNAT superfamily N-acetyltransferase
MLSLRPVRPEDDAFLFELYAGTRPDLAGLGLPEAQRDLLLRMQWRAQQQGYQARYPGGEHQVVLVEGRPVGRLWVARGPEEWRLVDVSLMPGHRGAGLGTGLLRSLQQEASRAGMPLRLSVARDNPARRLYGRLGFHAVDGGTAPGEPYLVLEWKAPLGATAAGSQGTGTPSG